MLDLNDKRIKLAGVVGRDIYIFTQHTPMTIEEIIESMCFVAGHALAQKAAQTFSTKKRLRQVAIAALDRGIDEGSIDRTGGLLIAPPQH